MPTLTQAQLATLLTPYLEDEGSEARPTPSSHTYLDLLLKWNARTNSATAIRDPEEIVRRHFGREPLRRAPRSPPPPAPSSRLRLRSRLSRRPHPTPPPRTHRNPRRIPEQEGHPFLREVVRTLGLKTEVWAARVEVMAPERRFDVVTMRAVDDMATAGPAAPLQNRPRRPAPPPRPPLTSLAPPTEPATPLPNSQTGVVYSEIFTIT